MAGKTKSKTMKGGKKRQLSSWNLFVMKLKKSNPKKTFKDILKMASTMKKKGLMKK